MERFAHSVEGQPEAAWELLPHHLVGVGRQTAAFAALFGASTIALAMGLLHDIGKMALAYQCQTAFKRDPRSASKRDPLFG